MSVLFYMDVHVPSAITTELRLRGVDVLTAQEDGASEFEDFDLLNRALILERVLVTQDTGFLREAARRQVSGEKSAGIAYAPQLGASIGEYVKDLELMAHASEAAEWVNSVVYLPLK